MYGRKSSMWLPITTVSKMNLLKATFVQCFMDAAPCAHDPRYSILSTVLSDLLRRETVLSMAWVVVRLTCFTNVVDSASKYVYATNKQP